MRIENRSRTCPRATLEHILAFLSKHCKYTDSATILVSDGTGKGRGRAYMCSPLGPGSLVQIWAVPGAYTSHTIPSLGPVQVANLEEQLVLILAHELRHLEQFHAGLYVEGQEVEAEVDAEVFARRLLDKYTYMGAQ